MVSRDTLEELAAVAQRLNAASDRLNAIICDFEERLEQTGVGVSVWLDSAVCNIEGQRLGYRKIGDRWRIAVCLTDDATASVPLATASRAVRLEAIKFFETLARAVLGRAVLMLADIEQANEQATKR